MLAAEQESRIDLDQLWSMAAASDCPSRQLTNDEERRISKLLDELEKDRNKARSRKVRLSNKSSTDRCVASYTQLYYAAHQGDWQRCPAAEPPSNDQRFFFFFFF